MYPVCREVQDRSGMLLCWSLACLFLGTGALSFFLGQEEEAAFSGGFLKHCVVPGR